MSMTLTMLTLHACISISGIHGTQVAPRQASLGTSNFQMNMDGHTSSLGNIKKMANDKRKELTKTSPLSQDYVVDFSMDIASAKPRARRIMQTTLF